MENDASLNDLYALIRVEIKADEDYHSPQASLERGLKRQRKQAMQAMFGRARERERVRLASPQGKLERAERESAGLRRLAAIEARANKG